MEIDREELSGVLRKSFDVDVISERTPLAQTVGQAVNGFAVGGLTFGVGTLLAGGSFKMALAETFACAATSAFFGYKNYKAAKKLYKDLTTITVTTVTQRPDGPEPKPAP